MKPAAVVDTENRDKADRAFNPEGTANKDATKGGSECVFVNELLLRILNLSPGVATYLDETWTDGKEYQLVFKALPTEPARLVRDICGDAVKVFAFDREGAQYLGFKGTCVEEDRGAANYAKELEDGSFGS